MSIDEKIKELPYNSTADVEYYTKGYRGIVGVPGRVVQARELTSLSLYPIYALRDITDNLFAEGILSGMEESDEAKIENGSVVGITTESITDLSKLKIYEISDDWETEDEVEVDLSQLEPDETEDTDDDDDTTTTTKKSREYSLTIYPHTGEDNWPHDIL